MRSRVACHDLASPFFRIIKELEIVKNRKEWSESELRQHMLHRDTELVIDGFQGSANSFATAYFTSLQLQPIRLAHHMHASGQIVRATKRGIPTIITIRDPRSAVLSLCSRWPHISPAAGVSAYLRFYRSVVPVVEQCVVSDFQTTVSDFGSVIEAVNSRFNRSYVAKSNSDDAAALIHARRDDARKRRQADLAEKYDQDNRVVKLHEAALHLYEQLARKSV